MSDLIFKTKGKETFRIPFPTPGTKCPETKLEIKMTEIEKTEAEIKVLEKKLELLKEIETHKSQPRMEFGYDGKFEIVFYNDKEYLRLEFTDGSHNWYKRNHNTGVVMSVITDGETRRLLEGLWFNEVNKGVIDEPTKPMDEVVERLRKKYEAQKLYNRLFELGYDEEDCDAIVDLVEDWILDEQNAEGSQNVDTELLVEGFNDAIRKMKEMLR